MSSSHFKRKAKQRRRKDEDGDPEFQVAPMVDVLLVLMLFFMSITSTEILKNDKNLHLADAEHGISEKDRANQLTINVTWDYNVHKPGFSCDGKTYAAPADMVDDIKKKAATNPNLYAVVRADRAVEYSYFGGRDGSVCKGWISQGKFFGFERRAESGSFRPLELVTVSLRSFNQGNHMAGGGGEEGEFGLQIAPMLDILFVLLLFFMVSAGSQKKERDLISPLPGDGAPDASATVPMNIKIDANNEVTMNGSGSLDPVQKDIKKPSELEKKLASIMADNADQPIIIMPSPKSTDQTIIDVLNACTGAKVKNIAFSGGGSGGDGE